MKTMYLRARRLEITASLYNPAKGLRAIHCLEKNTQSRIRGVGSGSQVIGRGAISSFYSYYLWKFRSFLCFFSFIVLLLYNPNKILQGTERKKNFPLHHLFLCCSRCHDLAKQLSHYLYFFSFSFLFSDLQLQSGVRESIM